MLTRYLDIRVRSPAEKSWLYEDLGILCIKLIFKAMGPGEIT